MRKWITVSTNKVGILMDDPAAILNIKTSETGESTEALLPNREIKHGASTIKQTWMKVPLIIHTLDWACSWWSFRFASADFSSRNSISLSSTCDKEN